ncbi:diaminopimelate epimerase [Corynebacterium sp. TAE3-ERU12]|uniref:diaminopimelate epimerase n=1 Tax=Corynebacterium sp. TAE3-ERU12 TaxID=2849491 RepID=UPI001C467660|nr:diaminopimelate epimerase [Corynebacterium sp. TAE3-ERU12]MBV7295284.1 diaminopimelate epimerase [Corynebacterium sp. TAE3-ERU12]
MHFLKGHGTENDFIIIPDASGELDLSAEQVAALCDRRAGIGADGILRVVRAGSLGTGEVLADGIGEDDWFMDYRNADGSIAEMCGNGVRVFAHYIASRGLADGPDIRVATRAGLRPVTVHSADERTGEVTVDMGTVGVLGAASCFVGAGRFGGVGIDVGNPHLACVVPGLDADGLAQLDLTAHVDVPADMFPAGVNLEILTPLREGAVHMRVIERGSGETRSCGTGTVAAAVAALADSGELSGTVTVTVPGGEVQVSVSAEGAATLTGPSIILAEGDVDLAAL